MRVYFLLGPLGMIEISCYGVLKSLDKCYYLVSEPFGQSRNISIFTLKLFKHTRALKLTYRLRGGLCIGKEAGCVTAAVGEIEAAYGRVVKVCKPGNDIVGADLGVILLYRRNYSRAVAAKLVCLLLKYRPLKLGLFIVKLLLIFKSVKLKTESRF